ncbi:MAG: hypothetical protein AABX30_02300 [Nanoarchaeota archaeon]
MSHDSKLIIPDELKILSDKNNIKGFKKRDVKLYSIAGWISDLPTCPCTAFAGYFRHDVLENLIVDGQLIDAWGPSRIGMGSLNDKSLKFIKQYHGRESYIEYDFIKEDSLWVGEWNGRLRDGESYNYGKSQCITSLVLDDAWNISCGAPRSSPSGVSLFT